MAYIVNNMLDIVNDMVDIANNKVNGRGDDRGDVGVM